MYHDAVANKAGLVYAVHLSFGNNCSCNGAHFRYFVNLAHFYLARHYFFLHLIEHALHSRVHVVDGIVDNRIGVYLHPFLVGQLACGGRWAHLETHDKRIGGIGQRNVVLRNLAHSLVNNVHLHLFGRELDERIAECLDRTVGIALDDNVQFFERTQCDAVRDVAQRQAFLRTQALFALQLQTFVGDVARLLFGFQHVEGIAGSRRTVQTQYDGGLCGTSTFYALVTLVEHGLDTSPACSGNHVIANMQRSVANKQRRNISATLV